MREHVLRVTMKDCEMQTFRAGGPGGQKQNKTSSGVRIIHHPSGARGESREERNQSQNKKTAFVRMANSPKFRAWVNLMHSKLEPIDLDALMAEENLLVEVRGEDGKWVPLTG